MSAALASMRYVSDSVSTASSGRLLVMLYDRLLLDLDRGEQDLRSGHSGSEHLLHAQEILLELRANLDLNLWPAARGLADIYVFLLHELIGANVGRDPNRVATSRALIEPLRDAWAESALQLATGNFTTEQTPVGLVTTPEWA
ncbi:flagellar protein FliS [mine drainage metagenome]|uniref:Flagellar protein FliS n=1 Tax=mine drainage metagenome TaxID=410659 RepID=A0A1J5QCF8_9ZZZZ